MKIAMICFSLTGFATGSRLKEALETETCRVTLDKKSRYLPDAITGSTGEWTAEQFEKADALFNGSNPKCALLLYSCIF